ELALESNWDTKLTLLAERSIRERITLVSGVPSWLLMLFQRVLELTGESSIGALWPDLEVVVHGGVKFDPYQKAFQEILGRSDIRLQETYPCSCGCSWIMACSTSSFRSRSSTRPTPRGTGWARSRGASTTRSWCRPVPGCGDISSATRCGSSRSTRRCSASR